jgi:tRNA-binding protein
MLESVATELAQMVDRAAIELRTIDDAVAGTKAKPEVWSVKEILGHLIDSAANNHQRFVRAKLATELSFPGYEQNAWVLSQDYQGRPWFQLVDLWVLYNHHLAHVIRRIPDAAANVPCRIGANAAVTLGALVEDYVAHVRHHLDQIQQRRAAASSSHPQSGIVAMTPAPVKSVVSVDDLEKLDIRVGTIRDVLDVASSKRLVQLVVSFGDHNRTILAGLKEERSHPRSLVGRQALFVVNLAPRKMAGIESEGMLFDIGYADGITPVLAQPEIPVPDGSRVG